MRTLIYFLVLLALVDGKTVHNILEEKSLILLQSRYTRHCDVKKLTTDDSRIKCEGRNEDYVPNRKICVLIPKTLDRRLWAKCEFGNWISIDAPDNTRERLAHREKRNIIDAAVTGAQIGAAFGPVGAAVGAILGGVVCLFFCSSPEPQYTVKAAPTYSNCPPLDIKLVYYAAEGTRKATVSWTDPTTEDSDGSIVSNTQTSTPKNGGSFQGTVWGYKHTVRYEAKDNDGLMGYCFFSFNVTVRTCEEPVRLQNGYMECNNGNIYGSICQFTCDEGYELSGSATAKCQEDGFWEGTASCSKAKCEKPGDLTHGMVNCPNPSYEYGSICSYQCHTGFALEGSDFMQCQANKTWTVSNAPKCIDVEPPTIECWTPQIFYADRGVLTSSSAFWEIPTASDTIDPNPVIDQTSGPNPGETLSGGSMRVTYQATDASGNTSPECSVELRVHAITCGHPADTLSDNNLKFKCTDSLYYYGISCELSCDYNLPLEGVDNVICEKNITGAFPVGSWEWDSEFEPYCREVECPPLDPPMNGALAYETVNRRPAVILSCNEHFDIPSIDGFNGQLFCYDSGSWYPLDQTPDCIYPRRPTRMRLPSELYYYSGECSDNATQQQIKQHFLDILTTEVGPLFNSICPGELMCTVDAVTVTCGPVSNRRRRRSAPHNIEKREETHVTLITFNIITGWEQGNMTIDESYVYTDNLQAQQKAVLETLLKGGKMNIPGLTLREDSFQTPETGTLSCEAGTRLDGSKCKPCPRGMYLDEATDKCTECPIGQYMDTNGTNSCKVCPHGQSTEKTGSKSLANCTDVCNVGSFSRKGLAPCALCPVGTYQDSVGMTDCAPCPDRQTTATQGSTSRTMCQTFDALIKDTNGDIHLGSMNTTGDFTFLMWARMFTSETAQFLALSLKDGQKSILSIIVSPAISVETGGQLLDTGVLLGDLKWYHIAVVWDREMSLVEVYIHEILKIQENISLPTFTSGDIVLYSTSPSGVYLTGLQVIEKKLSTSDIFPLLMSCTDTLEQTLISMDALIDSSNIGINIIIPAICDAVDECSTSPCGEHRCVNEIGDFRCICSKGMTGRLCEYPKDHCINNECKNAASCINNVTDYSCLCQDGYSGSFCEFFPVNGGWSDYGEWSVCSVTCGEGTRSKARTCNNPLPGIGGLDCTGSANATELCIEGICKECGEPKRAYGIKPNCTTNAMSEIKQCEPYCRDGTVMPPGLKQFDTYKCGPETNYDWIPVDWFPACQVPGSPRRYELNGHVEFSSAIPSSATSDVKSKIMNNFSSLNCVNSSLCDVSVALGNSGSRKKRNTGSSLDFSVEIKLGTHGELRLDEYLSTRSVSPTLQEVINAIVSLEMTAADMQANASSYFNVESGGISYSITNSTLILRGNIHCPEGSVSHDGVCVACPMGSKADLNVCVYCDVGTYQDEIGQTDCKMCPNGYSTASFAASDVSDCTVSWLSRMPSTSATNHPGDDDDVDIDHSGVAEDTTESGAFAGVAIGAFALGLLTISITLILYKKCSRKWRINPKSWSLASLSYRQNTCLSRNDGDLGGVSGLEAEEIPNGSVLYSVMQPSEPPPISRPPPAYSYEENDDRKGRNILQPMQPSVTVPPDSICFNQPLPDCKNL